RHLPAQARPADLLAAQAVAARVHAAPALLDYVQALLAASRNPAHYVEGLSPRAGLALLAAARAWAWLDGRGHLIPEDVQSVLPAVAGHRMRAAERGTGRVLAGRELVLQLLQGVPV
ncbi:MAG: hypothetical protein RL669_6, partial [Pseudomonadota bacterium]